MILRPYQLDAVQRVIESLHCRPILVAPTGSGKTVMGVEIAQRLGARVLWVAHRRELIAQAVERLEQIGVKPGVILSGEPVISDAQIQVASVQTLARREIPDCQLIVIDECHHATASSYKRLVEYPVCLIGMTATPFRLDGKGLGEIFGEIVTAATPADLVEQGYLVAPRVFVPPRLPDLSKIKITAGDYNAAEVGEVMEDAALVGDIIEHWAAHAGGRRTVVFATNVQHSMMIVRAFEAAGVAAAHLDGTTHKAERKLILWQLREGVLQVVSNCMVLTEGWDLPALECAIVARPTASMNLHLQMLGRIMRKTEDKAGAIVLDHAGNHHRHGEVTREIKYSLTDKAQVRKSDLLNLKRCPECGLMCELGTDVCPECGFVFESIPQEIAHDRDTDLVEYEDSMAYRQRWWSQIKRTQESMGYQDGWSAYRYKERFDEWPTVIGGKLLDKTDTSMENKAAVYYHFVSVAESRGFKSGWAAYRYRDVFGVWPRVGQGRDEFERISQEYASAGKDGG